MPRRALWFFQRTGPGQIRRISNPSMQRFLVGERALPQDGDGFVRCIGMSLEVQDRKPAQVARVWFSKIRACFAVSWWWRGTGSRSGGSRTWANGGRRSAICSRCAPW